jgi:hypothetical protein
MILADDVAHPGLREIEKGVVVNTENIVFYDMHKWSWVDADRLFSAWCLDN